jgi:hypothetical protein
VRPIGCAWYITTLGELAKHANAFDCGCTYVPVDPEAKLPFTDDTEICVKVWAHEGAHFALRASEKVLPMPLPHERGVLSHVHRAKLAGHGITVSDNMAKALKKLARRHAHMDAVMF